MVAHEEEEKEEARWTKNGEGRIMKKKEDDKHYAPYGYAYNEEDYTEHEEEQEEGDDERYA